MPGMRPTSNASLRAPPERRRTRGINACSLRWYYVPRGTDQMRVSRVAPTSVVGAIGGTHEHHSSDSDDSKRYDPPRSAQPGRQSHLTDVCCSSRSVRKDCVTQSASSVDRQRTHLAGWRCKNCGQAENHRPPWKSSRVAIDCSKSCQRDVPDVPMGERAAIVPPAGEPPLHCVQFARLATVTVASVAQLS